MACWHCANSDKRFFFVILFQDEPVFHCCKAKWVWDLTINSRTPEINYRRIYSLCYFAGHFNNTIKASGFMKDWLFTKGETRQMRTYHFVVCWVPRTPRTSSFDAASSSQAPSPSTHANESRSGRQREVRHNISRSKHLEIQDHRHD
jgi:hypothetical protein